MTPTWAAASWPGSRRRARSPRTSIRCETPRPGAARRSRYLRPEPITRTLTRSPREPLRWPTQADSPPRRSAAPGHRGTGSQIGPSAGASVTGRARAREAASSGIFITTGAAHADAAEGPHRLPSWVTTMTRSGQASDARFLELEQPDPDRAAARRTHRKEHPEGVSARPTRRPLPGGHDRRPAGGVSGMFCASTRWSCRLPRAARACGRASRKRSPGHRVGAVARPGGFVLHTRVHDRSAGPADLDRRTDARQVIFRFAAFGQRRATAGCRKSSTVQQSAGLAARARGIATRIEPPAPARSSQPHRRAVARRRRRPPRAQRTILEPRAESGAGVRPRADGRREVLKLSRLGP